MASDDEQCARQPGMEDANHLVMKNSNEARKGKAPRIVRRTPSEPAAAFITGAVVGAAAGSVAGPAGAMVGALAGGALAGIAGVALEEEQARRDKHDEELDEELGVTSRSMKGTWEEQLDHELSEPPPPPK
jgi:hypothetical protein